MPRRWPWMLASLCVYPAIARAIPGIDGHMTDPAHLLGDADKKAIEERLGDLQAQTHIDVAGWILEAPDAELETLANQAYRQWSIGKAWDNAVFFAIPPGRPARLILDRARPELSPAEQSKVLAADNPALNLRARIERLADATGSIVRNKVFRARPPGKKDLRGALVYGVPAMLVLLAACFMSLGRARARPQ
jgi:hypothetical protein